jgi:hypothetical protein
MVMKVIKSISIIGILSIFLSGISLAQTYTVIKNPHYGKPGESEFIVEDSSTKLTPASSKSIEFRKVLLRIDRRGTVDPDENVTRRSPTTRLRYHGPIFTYESVYNQSDFVVKNAIWNPLLLKKQISNMDKRIADILNDKQKTIIDKEIAIARIQKRQDESKAILSTVEAEISHHPMLSR